MQIIRNDKNHMIYIHTRNVLCINRNSLKLKSLKSLKYIISNLNFLF